MRRIVPIILIAIIMAMLEILGIPVKAIFLFVVIILTILLIILEIIDMRKSNETD